VIVPTGELARLRGKVSMVDGGFDPLHAGHVAYFREARALGLPLLCNVSSDDYVSRKHPPLLAQGQRAEVIDAIRFVDYVHPASGTTAEVLRDLAPRYYVKGADWRGRLPAEELEICAENGTEIVYLDTVVDSSTSILERYAARCEGREHRL
jgi:D-beta-D-heptose 7-phosphate kinase/D-beta-D-heptose 1-phosphate adenosyltransferase